MFWANKILIDRDGKEIINDSFTPSGNVHMGSLKGPIIHDVLYRTLKKQGKDVIFMYGLDDMDPIDGLSSDLYESHKNYFGMPLFKAPAPDFKGSFGDYFGKKMRCLLDQMGVFPTIVYKTSDYYINGTFNKAISFVLDNAKDIRKVYEEMYKKEIPNNWFPFQVICPNCGKLGTTKVTAWDGKEVTFSCEENLVKWAKGCGACGKISPFNGNGKMPWKVEWASKWWTFGVTMEGAGKDHASAGGSYDIAMKIVEDVFKVKQPLRLAYEFFLSGGKKMGSSKGIGTTGEDLLKVLVPEAARFLMIKTPPNQAIEFTPYNTDLIPKLYDDYQKSAEAYFTKQNEDLAEVFELSQIGRIKKPPKIRFSQLAQWIQMPNMQDSIKKEGLEEWANYAGVWVEKYASESEKFTIKNELPEEAKKLSEKQKEFLKKVSKELEKKWEAEEFQKNIYEWAKEFELPSKEAFSAIYIYLLGKDHGPKAGWLILSLDKKFVQERIEEIEKDNSNGHSSKQSQVPDGTWQSASKIGTNQDSGQARITISPEFFSINKELRDKFPSISVGVALIKGVEIQKENNILEKEKKELLESFANLTTEELGQYLEVISYRKLYKAMGIDWHSRRPSPEALLRRVALKKGLYTINTCVDAYNLVVMNNRISIGAFDLDKIEFPTTLRFAKEGEEILLLGDEVPTKYKNGEIAYFDQKGGFNIDFNYRDAQRTAVSLTTKNLYINVDGVYDIAPGKIESVLKQACEKIIKYCGGKIELFGVETAE